jgi:cobalt-zinc-cadmium efflux system membrane fusion protein
MSDATILIVDDDDVLGQILTRVLSQQGYHVERATDAAQALQLAREHPPQLGLLDLCLPDQDGVELAKKLRAEAGALPLILMTAYPLSLREQPERVEGFARVLTKPLNLQELRQAVDSALANGGEKRAAPTEAVPRGSAAVRDDIPEPGPAAAAPAEAPRAAPPAAPAPAANGGRRWLAWAGALAGVAVLVGAVLVGMRVLGQQAQQPPPEPGPRKLTATLAEGRRDTLLVPEDVVRSLAIQTAEARPATQPQPLELAGTLALDTDHLVRLHARFGGEVIELGKVEEGSGEFATVPRPVRFGDHVKQGELLAVVWSKELGEKKSELVDALSQLRVDKDTLDRLEELYPKGAVPEVQMRQARRAYEASLTAVARAERTLRVWRVPQKEIDALREEADRIRQRGGKHDTATERNWARVDVTAPFAGVVVEKNVTVGDIVDTTTDLFKVARVDVLTVWAHAYEEDLPALHSLSEDERRWTIRILADPTSPPVTAPIERIGYVIDPNQHTALVTGRLENPSGAYRAGQFITATVELPPPADAVTVPIGALVEDGEQTVIFVQTGRAEKGYTPFQMRRVLVVQRRHDVALVRWLQPEWVLLSTLAPPATPVNLAAATLCDLPAAEPDVRVVTSGALEMKGALDDLLSGK